MAKYGNAVAQPRQVEESMGPKSALERTALRVSNFTERWFPDAFVIALIALLIVSVAALAIGAPVSSIVGAVGDGFWNLNNFTYQMAMVVITGFAVASCGPVRRGIMRLASIPKTGPGAVVFIIVASIGSALLNWGFGMMFSAFLVMAMTAREDLDLDIRAAAAAGILGTGSTSMLGLSSSAALLHATPSSVPPELLAISGEIPLNDTVFLWQNGVAILFLLAVAMFVGYKTAPRGNAVRTARDFGIDTGRIFAATEHNGEDDGEKRPGDYLSRTPLVPIALGITMLAWIGLQVAEVGFGKVISNLNNYIFITLTIAILLHGSIGSLLRAISQAVPAVGPILIQFPIYAAVASVLMLAKNATGLSVADYLGEFFVAFANEEFLPVLVGAYSIIVGVFIPSAGAKWILEAPYILQAGIDLQSHLGWLINAYSASENIANLLNPFWMLPMVGLLTLRVRYVVGFTFMYFIFLAPAMLFIFWLLGLTLDYLPPVMP